MNQTSAFDKESRVAKRNMEVQRKMLKSVCIMCGMYMTLYFCFHKMTYIHVGHALASTFNLSSLLKSLF